MQPRRVLSEGRKYALLTAGSTSLLDLLRYEILTGLLSGLSGALGYASRRWFYRLLFSDMGRNVTIGRHVAIRGGRHISLGSNVLIEDFCVLDARGPDASIHIEDEALIGRNSIVRTRGQELRIGKGTNIGANSILATSERLSIGKGVLVAAYAYIMSGEQWRFADRYRTIKEQGKAPTGGSVIEDGVWLGARATVLGGVTIGEGAVVGAHSLVTTSLPAMTIAYGSPAKVRRERGPSSGCGDR